MTDGGIVNSLILSRSTIAMSDDGILWFWVFNWWPAWYGKSVTDGECTSRSLCYWSWYRRLLQSPLLVTAVTGHDFLYFSVAVIFYSGSISAGLLCIQLCG